MKIKMNEKAMYKFQLYHNYKKPATLGSALVGLITIILSISWVYHGDVQNGLVFLLFGCVLVFLPPFTLRQKSKQQVLRNKVFQKPMEYTINDNGVVLFQQGNRGEVKWEDFTKATFKFGNLLLYTGKAMALILPKDQIGDSFDDVVSIITKNMSAPKTKGLRRFTNDK